MSDAATEIANLLFTYGSLIDSGDFEGIGRIFAHARLADEHGQLDVQGAENVTALYHRTTRLYPDTGTPKTKHLMTNLIIEVDEEHDSATCRSYFTVLQATETLPLQPIIAGRYEDRFERVDGRWRFAEKKFFTDLAGDLRQHLLIGLEQAHKGEGAQS